MFSRLADYTVRFARHRHAAWWLFFYSIIESLFFPVPPDVLLAPLSVANPQKSIRFAIIAATGSVIGGVIGYYIGYFAFDLVALPVLNFFCDHYGTACPADFMPKLYHLFDKYGVWFIGISAASPAVPYRFTILAAGLARMAIVPFIVVSFFSHLVRYTIVCLVAAKYGPKAYDLLRNRLPHAFAILGILALVVCIAVIYF